MLATAEAPRHQAAPIVGMERQVETITIGPQPGPQTAFLSSPADIVIYGGGAGGGKTYGLLLEPTRHIDNPRFGAVIFRRTYKEVTNEGGMWDESEEIYPLLGARGARLMWTFPSGARVRFAHMQHEKHKHNWQGAQVAFFGFDQLEHFTWGQFSYMFSRSRSTCGVKPYIRATANPDVDHWLREFLRWWINDKTGLAIQERSGQIRWFVMVSDEVIWDDTREGLIKDYGCQHQLEQQMDEQLAVCPVCDKTIVRPKSCTFIASSVFDNPALLKKDPGYLANLQAMPLVDRERLLGCNWNIRPSAGMFFRRDWFKIVDAAPHEADRVRYWDRAATEVKEGNDPSFTAGVKMSRSKQGAYYIEDVTRFRATPLVVERALRNTASQDGVKCLVGIEQDPGSAGKAEAQSQVRNLAGFRAKINIVRESKGVRAKPFSAQAEAGNVMLVRGPWNEAYLRELENFDGTDKGHADQVDGSSGGFLLLTTRKRAGAWGRR